MLFNNVFDDVDTFTNEPNVRFGGGFKIAYKEEGSVAAGLLYRNSACCEDGDILSLEAQRTHTRGLLAIFDHL